MDTKTGQRHVPGRRLLDCRWCIPTYMYNNNKGTTATVFFFYTYNNITYTFVFMRSVETIIYVGRRGFRGVERTVVGRCGVGREKKNNGLPDVFTVFILYIRTYVCIYYIYIYIRVERSTTSPSSFFKKKCFFFLLFLFVYYVHM